MISRVENRVRTELPDAFVSDFFKDKMIESVTWTDVPDEIPMPADDPNSDINLDYLDYDYHFIVVINENGNLENIPVTVRIEIE